MLKITILVFSLTLAGCGGGGSSGGGTTNPSTLVKSKNGFNLVTSNYLLTTCPVSAGVPTNVWYKCLGGTSFTGVIDLFSKQYCEIAVGNDGAFHYISDTEHLTTVNAATYLQNDTPIGTYSLINSGNTLGTYLVALLSSSFPYNSQFSGFSIHLMAYSNRFSAYVNNSLSYQSTFTIDQKSGTSTTTKSRTCYINSLD